MGDMKLNIIFDARMIDRYEPLIDELKRQNITDYEIWPCIMLKDVVSSINASHKMIVRDAKEKGLAMVAIAEDDIYFPAQDGWKYFLKSIPEIFDIYLACTYITPIDQKQVVGFHLYIVHERFYDKFLSVKDDIHIDTAMNGLGDMQFCYPFAALQRKGFSSNNKTICDYSLVLKDEDIYKG